MMANEQASGELRNVGDRQIAWPSFPRGQKQIGEQDSIGYPDQVHFGARPTKTVAKVTEKKQPARRIGKPYRRRPLPERRQQDVLQARCATPPSPLLIGGICGNISRLKGNCCRLWGFATE